MRIFQHRVNSLEELCLVPTEFGVEIDIRSNGESLVLAHDPFMNNSVRFEDWLTSYHHHGIILNIKEEGLEVKILKLLEDHAIEDFFFLDQSFPYLVRTIKQGEYRCAVRVSDFESAETARSLNPMPEWVWLDSFTGDWQHLSEINNLVSQGYKTCLVSPELQGRKLDEECNQIVYLLDTLDVKLDAVCTKNPEVWWGVS